MNYSFKSAHHQVIKILHIITKTKGSQCSVYEKTVHDVIKHCAINNKSFNTQKGDELGGSSSKKTLNVILLQR